MNFIRVTDDADRDTIAEAIGNLRARRRACVDPVVAGELDADIDELLDMIAARA